MAPPTDLLLMVTSIRDTFMFIFNSTLILMMMMLRKARDLKLTQFIPPVFPRVVSERVKNDPKIQAVCWQADDDDRDRAWLMMMKI